MKRVALLGGSFNPPHLGHLLAAVYMRTIEGCDEVWLVPSFHHPFGKPLEAFEDRVALCEAMAAPVGPWLQVSRAEAEVGGEGRTIELLEFLIPRNRDTQFTFMIGSDIVADLPKWKAWDRIQSLVKVIILNRAGFPAAGSVGPPLAEVSSTQIRQLLEAGQEPVELVPQGVLKCAKSRGLFGLKA